MPSSSASTITTGAHLRQFILDALCVRGLHQPANWPQGPALDAYLSSLWHAAQAYRNRPFQFYFMAEMLEKAFDFPLMPYDWEPELQQPYRPVPDHIAPYQTPEYFAEMQSYAYFERVVKRQIGQVKRIFRLPELPPYGDEWAVLDGHRAYWANIFVEPFLERGTVSLEEAFEVEQDVTWGYLTGILQHGQYTE
jgi:hypothetical protein